MQATSIRRVPRRWFTLSLASTAVLATITACGGGDDGPSAEQAADKVFINATVLTVNAQDAQAQAIAVKDGKVLRVGSLADVESRAGQPDRGRRPGRQNRHPRFSGCPQPPDLHRQPELSGRPEPHFRRQVGVSALMRGEGIRGRALTQRVLHLAHNLRFGLWPSP